jgi:hypothetical protein
LRAKITNFYENKKKSAEKKQFTTQINAQKKPSVSRQSVPKTNYLKTNLLKQIKKNIFHSDVSNTIMRTASLTIHDAKVSGF